MVKYVHSRFILLQIVTINSGQNVKHNCLKNLRINKSRRIQRVIEIWEMGLLLPLLSRFSRVRLLATPWTAAHQAPPSMGFSKQEYWSGVPLPSPRKWD